MPDHWQPALVRKIVWLLAVKIAAILLLFFLFFAPADRPDVTPESVADHVGGGDAPSRPDTGGPDGRL